VFCFEQYLFVVYIQLCCWQRR